MPRFGSKGQTYHRSYTIDEVSTLLLDPKVEVMLAERGLKHTATSHDKHNDTWAGCSWEESVEYLTKGWKKGAANLDVNPNIALRDALRPKTEWDVAGSEVDVALYLAGIPECMGEVVKRKRPSQVVRIGVDKAIACNVDKERIKTLGRNILTLVESLRMAGVPAEVWVCQGVRGYEGDVMDMRICVQEVARPIDISRLAFWVAHPGSLRRTIFALEETENETIRRKFSFDGGGYGMPYHNFAKDDFDEWTPSPQQPDHVIEKWVNEVLDRRAGR